MSPVKMSRIESAVRVVIRLIDAINTHDIGQMESLFDDDVVFEDAHAGNSPAITGRTAVVSYLEQLLVKVPELSVETEELIGFGNRCILRWLARWDEKQNAQPVRGLTLFQIRNDRLTEILSYEKHKASKD